MSCALRKTEKGFVEFYCNGRNVFLELLIGGITSLFALFKTDVSLN